jgi:EAL domain-containing protein (putative c-di-GMP-specific phosphodiesterase class I)
VRDLTGLLRHFIRSELEELHREGVRLRIIGDRGRFDRDIQADLLTAETRTMGNTRLNLTVALSYGARGEIVAAARAVVEAAKAGLLDPALLELEITESVLMDNPERAKDLLSHLKAQGIRVAIDDFGTGYSSLGYLSRFPIDRLKIDRSFVASSITDPNGAAIVGAVISLARSLGLSAIAEGVESEEQRQLLKRHGCDQIQGYLLGRPMAATAIGDFLSSLSPHRNSPAGPGREFTAGAGHGR